MAKETTIKIFNGNTKFVITLACIVCGFVATWGGLKATVANQQKAIDQKVDKVEYQECVKRIDEKLAMILNIAEARGK